MTGNGLIIWLFAFSPILAVLVLMIFFNWGGAKAGAAGWFAALAVSILFFGAHPDLIAVSQTKAILLSLNVLYIIWPALLHFNVVNETGGIQAIGNGIRRYSNDRAMQILIFGWIFSSFLQGVAGYGVPIAVVAPLLYALGFSPVVSVAVPAIGHSWAVTFGSMGASFQALMAVTGLGYESLAGCCALLLGICTFLCGIFSVHVYGGWKSIAHCLPALFIIGLAMSGTQYFLAVSGLWSLGGFGASIAGFVTGLMVARLKRYTRHNSSSSPYEKSLKWAVSAYLVLILVMTAGIVVEPLRDILGRFRLSLSFPEISTRTGFFVPSGNGKTINVFGHAGALLLYSSAISFMIFHFKRFYSPGSVKQILKKTVQSGIPTSAGIVTMVCFALIMDHAGMIQTLAQGVSRVFGSVYPLISPWIGLLGAFMTGSNTNSNVVFGVFQQNTAQLAGISVALILAAQTTGGALGSMIAPAKLIVGCSTVGLSGKEGPVLKKTMAYGLVITLIVGLITWGGILAGF